MPTDEDGNKWACEACVRGHRATRCDHFDRWMVRVKKPGRPLQNCPHATGPCTCNDEKVIMMRIPRHEQRGNCNCRIVRTFDPAVDDDNSQPSRRPSRVQDPLDPARMIPYQNVQPIQPFPEPLHAQYLASYQQLTTLTTRRTSARIANGQGVRAESSHGLPLHDTMRPQQPASDPSSSDLATPVATPTTSTQGSQSPHQEQSHSVAQVHSPTTVQGDGFPQQVLPDINVYSNLQLRPGHLDAANLQPQFAPYSPYQPIMNGDHEQGTRSLSSFVQPNLSIPYEADPAHPLTLAQALHFESLGYRYPEPRELCPLISPAVPSAELNALANSSNCMCGAGCNCVFCAAHPYNDATRERVQDLNQIMAMDDYWSWNHVSPPQSGYGGAPTNGTNMESVMGQGYPPLDEESFASAASGWMNAPIEGPEQPTFDEGASVENGDQSHEVPPRTMRNSEYYTMEFPVNSNCTDATGTCLCGDDCKCYGCATHQGHNGLPN